jgi:hypothetical protein
MTEGGNRMRVPMYIGTLEKEEDREGHPGASLSWKVLLKYKKR